jgi:hypothetical protein
MGPRRKDSGPDDLSGNGLSDLSGSSPLASRGSIDPGIGGSRSSVPSGFANQGSGRDDHRLPSQQAKAKSGGKQDRPKRSTDKGERVKTGLGGPKPEVPEDPGLPMPDKSKLPDLGGSRPSDPGRPLTPMAGSRPPAVAGNGPPARVGASSPGSLGGSKPPNLAGNGISLPEQPKVDPVYKPPSGEQNSAEQSTMEQAGLRDKSDQEEKESKSLYDGVKGYENYKEARSSRSGRQAIKKQFTRKQRAKMGILSFFITGMVGLGVTFGGFALGPGQLISFAENMKDFSFGANDDQTVRLTTRIYKRIFIKNPGDRDLTVVGRKIANHYDDILLNEKGIELVQDKRGNLVGVKEYGELTIDLSDEKLGVRGDKAKLRGAQAQRRAVLGETVRDGLEVGKFKYYTRYRHVMQSRFRVKFSVFENLDRKARVKANEFLDKKFRPAVVDGDVTVTGDAKEKKVDDDATDAEKKDAADKAAADKTKIDEGLGETDDLAQKTRTSAERTKLGKAIHSPAGKIGLSAVGLSALACTVIAVNENVKVVAYAQRYVPLIRLFNFFQTMDSQIKSGELSDETLPTEKKDDKNPIKQAAALGSTVAMQEISEAASILAPAEDGPNAGVSWIDSAPGRRSYGAKWEGQPEVSKDMSASPTALASGLNKVSEALSTFIPAPFCSFAASGPGSFALTALDIASNFTPLGLATFATGEVLTRAFADDVINAIVSFAGGPALDLLGADSVDIAGMAQAGGIGSNSEREKSEGGRPLSLSESLALRTDHIEERKRAFASRPMKDRIFDYTHPDSIATAAIVNMPQNKQQLATMMISAPLKMLSSVAAIVSPAVKAQQQAACNGTYNAECLSGFNNYNILDYGFTDEEISYILSFNPDELIDWGNGEANAIGTPPDKKTRDEWRACFDASTEPEEGEDKDGPVNSGGWSDECQSYMDTYGDTFLKYRGFLRYEAIQEGIECAASDECPEGQTEAGVEVGGAAQTPSGEVNGRGSSTTCAPGTTPIGEQQFWEKKKSIPSLGCEIPGFPASGEEDRKRNGLVVVSAASSQQFLNMLNAAKADGIALKANSSFRSYEYQEELFIAKGRNTAVVAEPGNSNHNGGNAVDIADMCSSVATCPRDKRGGVYDKSMGCEKTRFVRSIDPSSRTWLWLEANAKKFGITQYCNEAWHWETKVYDGG